MSTQGSITITIPEQLYNSVIDLRAHKFIEDYFSNTILISLANRYTAMNISLSKKIELALNNYQSRSNKIAFLTVLLTHFTDLVQQIDNGTFKGSNNIEVISKTKLYIDEIIFESLQHLEQQGIDVSSDTFTAEEFNSVNNILNQVLSELEVIRCGNAVLGAQIEDLLDDITEIKQTMVLGKKNFRQRITGVVATYAATKSADEVFDAVKPHLGKLLHVGFNEVTRFLSS